MCAYMRYDNNAHICATAPKELNRGIARFKESFSCVPMISLHQTSLSGLKPRENPLFIPESADKVTDLLLRSGRTPKLSVSGKLRNT